MTTPLSFHHVALNCGDPAAQERFYTKHFGFRRARAIDIGGGDQIIFIKLGDSYIEIFRTGAERPGLQPEKDGPVQPGVRHVAFKVDDVDACVAGIGDEARITLGPLEFDSIIPGWKTVWMADPEGNIIEISQGFVDDRPV